MIKSLPYHPQNQPHSFNRLLILPLPKEETTTEAGLLIPTDIGKICESGRVVSVCQGSDIHTGDIVLYNKVDRKDAEHIDTISIEGERYDSIYENEVWAVNGHPFNRIFVEPLSELQVSEEGIILPAGVRSVTQKGKVFRSPDHYSVKPGALIEYRKQEREMYPTVDIDGTRYDVIYEGDVYIVNDVVAPYRIIVKIDIAAQRIKRNTSQSGLLKSKLFEFMLYNMQVGEVTEIGHEAMKNFPNLKVGDQAILHHFIESQPHRLLKQEIGKVSGHVIFEWRIIDGFKTDSREIFGRISNRKNMTIVPFGKSKFFDWDFDLHEKAKEQGHLFTDFDYNLDKCHNLDSLKSAIDHKKETGISKGKAKVKGLIQLLSQTDARVQKDKFDQLESELQEAQNDAMRMGYYLNANHLLEIRELETHDIYLASFKELYPINLFGKQFLIAYEDFVISKINTDKMGNTTIEPLFDRLLVKPIEDARTSVLLIPDSAKEKAQTGEVIAVGKGKDNIPLQAKVGDTVYYRKGAGIPIPGEKGYLMMKEGVDTIGILVAETTPAI